MNIVLAQLKKDILCQRRPLILWGVCLGMGAVLYAILATFSHLHNTPLAHLELSDMQKVMGVVSIVAVIMLCMFAVGFGMFLLLPVLVIRIVHEDTLMGTTAFWLTRPIPRGKLLLAKTLFIVVLLLPLVLAGGFGGNDAHPDGGHFWPAETAWLAAVAALSAITPGVLPLLGYGLAFLFGKIVFSGIIDRLWNHYHGEGSVPSDGMIHHFSPIALIFHVNAPDFFNLCYLVGFSAVFIHQYLTLRTRRSIALFIATLVAVGLLQMFAGSPADTSTGPVLHFDSTTIQTP